MKLGWMAAGAVLIACAGQADATTWLRYEITGNGVEVATSSFPTLKTFTAQRDFRLNFSVEVDPTSGTIADPVALSYGSDGSLFYATNIGPGLPGGLTVDGYQSSILSVKTGTFGSPSLSMNVAFSYADGDSVVALPRLLASGMASGTIDYFAQSKSITRKLTGTVTGFSILGTTTGFEGVELTTVPEPATWAMIIFGAGAIGVAMRRRQRVAFA